MNDDEYCESWVNGGTRCIMRRQDHRRRSLHHEEVGYPSAPYQIAMEMEVEVSLTGDDTYSKVVLVNVPFKGEGGKRYINLVLNLVRKVKKEDENEEEEANLRRK
jgi:hypothetical protein